MDSGIRWKIFSACVPARDCRWMMKEYNGLTKRLLKEGYTVSNFPNYVQIDTSRLPGDDPLNNASGGFEYKRWYSDRIVYKTGCGRFTMGENVIDNMAYMGVDWTHENGNPVIWCPFDRAECPDNDSRLHGIRVGGLCIQCLCVCHKTASPYDFENSIEKADKERREEKERKYKEYADVHNGRVCQNHMYYDERTREWHLRYDPEICAVMCCSKNGYCPILNKKLSRKRGNVYYDVKTSGIYQRRGDQISMLDGTPWTNVRKAVRYFKKPCSIDICEAFVKIGFGKIRDKYYWGHSGERLTDPSWDFEILNIRAESKPSRDLIQDLEDIRAGISIVFDPDWEKESAERKKQARALLKQKKIEKLEQKILETGYGNLKEYSLDRIHADKWLTRERIAELESQRRERLKKESHKPVQITLGDYAGIMPAGDAT